MGDPSGKDYTTLMLVFLFGAIVVAALIHWGLAPWWLLLLAPPMLCGLGVAALVFAAIRYSDLRRNAVFLFLVAALACFAASLLPHGPFMHLRVFSKGGWLSNVNVEHERTEKHEVVLNENVPATYLVLPEEPRLIRLRVENPSEETALLVKPFFFQEDREKLRIDKKEGLQAYEVKQGHEEALPEGVVLDEAGQPVFEFDRHPSGPLYKWESLRPREVFTTTTVTTLHSTDEVNRRSAYWIQLHEGKGTAVCGLAVESYKTTDTFRTYAMIVCSILFGVFTLYKTAERLARSGR